MKRAPGIQRGFTLIEVLVALTIMALLAVLSWRALDATARSSERLDASTDDTLALMRVLGQIESDLSRHSGANMLRAAAQIEAAEGKPEIPAGNTLLPPGILWAPPALTVLRSAHDGAWQQVVWQLAGGTLWRAAGPPGDRLPLLPAQAEAAERMLEGVRAFSLRAWLPGRGWSDTAAPDGDQAATGLEIAIARHHDGVDETYRKVVLLP